jgi:hypothetical protein
MTSTSHTLRDHRDTDSTDIQKPSTLTHLRAKSCNFRRYTSLPLKTDHSLNVCSFHIVNLTFTLIPIAIPNAGENSIKNDEFGPKCKFGRFGNGPATYINATTILCLTPSISENPKDIYEETVKVTVTMNGEDFNTDHSSAMYTFIGTGGAISLWVVIMGTLVFSLLAISLVIFFNAIMDLFRSNEL